MANMCALLIKNNWISKWTFLMHDLNVWMNDTNEQMIQMNEWTNWMKWMWEGVGDNKNNIATSHF